MKISITDKFLWTLYNSTEELLDIYDFFKIKTFKEIATDQSFWKNLKRKKRKKQFGQFINYLKKKNYIKINKKTGILITPKGKEKALKTKYKLLNKKTRKDGKWIMLMYDIPEKNKRKRFFLKNNLKNLGYQQFQKSVWVCPYDTFKETRELIDLIYLNNFVKIFLIEEILIK